MPILQMGNQGQERSDDLPKVRKTARPNQQLGGFSFIQAPLPSRDWELIPWHEWNHRLERKYGWICSIQNSNQQIKPTVSVKLSVPYSYHGQSSFVCVKLSWPQLSLPDPLVQWFNTHYDGEHFYIDILTDWIRSSDIFIPLFPIELLSTPEGMT